ncbi:MAG: EipB family protein, partial [Alphaproteobacteria bacterium]
MTGRLIQFMLCATILFGLGVAGAEARRGGVEAAPYRGTYEMSMRRADPTTGIHGASGQMTMEWMDVCEGYTLNQRIMTELIFREGENMVTDLRVSTWESRNGKKFRFSYHNYVNGEPAEVSQGEAERNGDGSGQADYKWPQGKEAQFPPGTVFPTAHGREVVRAARAGRRSFSRIVFDGAPDGALYRAVAFIGDKRRAERTAGRADPP